MKKAEKIEELKKGQRVRVGDDQKEHVIRLVEDKLVPYVVTDDNSCHCLYRGIWIVE